MRRSRRRLSGADRAAAAVFHEEGLRPGVCQVCLKPECVPLQSHHVIDASRIRDLNRGRRRDGLVEIPVYSVDDSLCVGEPCHSAHTSAAVRIPQSALRAENWAFAEAWGLIWAIERFYPDDRMRCIG